MDSILSELPQNNLPKRHHFILRIWQNHAKADWEIMLQETDGKIHTFPDLMALMIFLSEKMPASI